MSTATEGPAAAKAYDPAAEYRRRFAARQATVRRVARWNRRITLGRRLMLFAVIGYVVFDPTEAQALIPVGIALAPLLFWQNAVLRRWRRASKAAAYYERGVARLENRWIGRGVEGRRDLGDTHLYAEDLDIFGRGSLFQLLCTAQTPMGQDTLAGWLSAPDELAVIRARQQLVRDLAHSLDLREALASLDADLGQVMPEGLVRWAEAPPLFPSLASRGLGMIFIGGWTLSFVGALVAGGGWWLAVIVFSILEAGFYLARGKLLATSPSTSATRDTRLASCIDCMRNCIVAAMCRERSPSMPRRSIGL